MSVKIGGFAAFCIALVIAGGVERIVHTVVNRNKSVCSPPTPKQDAFWAEFATKLAELRAASPTISAEELPTKLKESLQTAYDAALAECSSSYEVDGFLEQLDRKLAALGRLSE
jgi:hypothetical protein